MRAYLKAKGKETVVFGIRSYGIKTGAKGEKLRCSVAYVYFYCYLINEGGGARGV